MYVLTNALMNKNHTMKNKTFFVHMNLNNKKFKFMIIIWSKSNNYTLSKKYQFIVLFEVKKLWNLNSKW